MIRNIFKEKKIILLLGSGFAVRLLLATIPGFKIDVDAWFAWALRLNELGFGGFYSEQTWTNYTPGFLYILYLFGLLKNLFQITDPAFFVILKLPSIIAEVLLGFLIYSIVSKRASRKLALLASSFILFNPALIFNSAIWGQIDGFLSLFLVSSIFFLNKDKFVLSSIFFGLAFLIKPQAIALAPVFILYAFKNRLSFSKFSKLILPGLLTVFILAYPFFPSSPFDGLIKLVLKMSGDYSGISLFALNFWGIFGFWQSDSQKFLALTFQHWGVVLFVFYWAMLIFLYLRKRIDEFSLAALATLGFYFLPTRIHERYLYPVIPFLIIAFAQFKTNYKFYLISALSLIHLVSLYYVYVYYNEFYLKLPKLLYFPLLYNFTDQNGKLLSFISTAIFVLIVITFIKNAKNFTKS